MIFQVFIILLLEYVETGRLWNFLRPYFDDCQQQFERSVAVDADVAEWPRENVAGYKGRRISFSVAVDTDRLARLSQQSLDEDEENPSTDQNPELCTIGVDAAAEAAETGPEILVPGPSELEDMPLRVEEEAPAPLRLRRSKAEMDPKSLCDALTECVRQLKSKKRTWWPENGIPENLIVHWAAQMVSALYVLHTNGEFICDLGPENILIGPDGNVLITSYAIWNGREYSEMRLRPGYSAPETFRASFEPTPEADIWTLGALIYELATGLPLAQAGPHGIGRPCLEPPFPAYCSASLFCRDLVNRILLEEPDERLTLDAIRAHPFFESIRWQLYDNPHTST
ncbi:unnamed protein product, partial [Mesorhabditis spiculigera]